MAVDVTQAIKDLIQRILGDRDTALQYAEDPEGTLAAQGVTEGDLSNLDMFQLVSETCGSVPGLQNYGPSYSTTGGGGATQPPPPSSTGQSVDQVMQHLNYVTHVAYEGDETITNVIDESTNIDQSQNVNVDAEGDIFGDITVDSHDSNVNATGDGSAAADEGTAVSGDEAAVADEGVAVSGDGSAASKYGPATAGDENLVNTGVNYGQQNTGDEAAQGFAYGDLTQNTGDDAAQATDVYGDVNQNTGEFTGIQSGGDANVAADALSFGEGDATSVKDVDVSEGGAYAEGGGGASGHKSDDDTEVGDIDVEVTDVDAYNSQVQTEQGPGDATATQVDDVNVGFVPRPTATLRESTGEESGDEESGGSDLAEV